MKESELQHAGDNSSNTSITNPAKITGDEHDTLKYHLLGPSLTKAGQDTVDQQKVNFLPETSRRVQADASIRYLR